MGPRYDVVRKQSTIPVQAFKGTNDRDTWSGASSRATRDGQQRNRDRVNFSNEPN